MDHRKIKIASIGEELLRKLLSQMEGFKYKIAAITMLIIET